MNSNIKVVVLGSALAALAAPGCGDGNAPAQGRVQVAYQALAGQFSACASSAAECLKAADCDEAEMQVCKDDFEDCRQEARAAAEAFRQAVRQCRADARECKDQVGDAGDDARQACRDALRACVADNRPERTPPPCLAELRECLAADPADTQACMEDARQCFVDSMPPRCDGGIWGFGHDAHRGDRHGGRYDGKSFGGRDCRDGGMSGGGMGDAGM